MPVKYIKKNPTVWDSFCQKSVHNLSSYNNIKIVEETSKENPELNAGTTNTCQHSFQRYLNIIL